MTDPTNPAPPAEELRALQKRLEKVIGLLDDREPRYVVLCAEAGIRDALDHLSVLTVENERMRAALERSDKFIGNYLSPWGSWKTAWWEGEVSDEMPFADDNALRRVGEIISAALSSLPAMKGEG